VNGSTGPAPLPQPLVELLHRWMPAQRWYPAKGRGVGLRPLGTRHTDDPAGHAAIRVHVVGLDSGDRVDVVQVPLTYRTAPLEGAEHALVGQLHDPDLGERWVYDGPHDPAYVASLLTSLRLPDGVTAVAPGSPSRVLKGEQSNTSIIVEPADAGPVIVKVFRTLHPGANPDVEVLAALSRVACPHVPALRGWLEGSWTSPDGATVDGHLAVAVDFLAGSEDAWRVALAAVGSGTPFTEQARGLGAATARVHADLATALGTTTVDEDARRRMVEALQGRVRWARSSVRELDAFDASLDAHVASLAELHDLPAMQRVHGDLHLGQVLQAPGHGWVLLDFEGEPLRPLHERTVPDLALRDVAGMLRSIDYAAGHDTVGRPDDDSAAAAAAAAQGWAEATRDAFCAGYGSVSGRDPRLDAALLRALELDKALYEVVYEARNRPSWLPIPLAAVSRLLA
jgi:predicted trehalose synthase